MTPIQQEMGKSGNTTKLETVLDGKLQQTKCYSLSDHSKSYKHLRQINTTVHYDSFVLKHLYKQYNITTTFVSTCEQPTEYIILLDINDNNARKGQQGLRNHRHKNHENHAHCTLTGQCPATY